MSRTPEIIRDLCMLTRDTGNNTEAGILNAATLELRRLSTLVAYLETKVATKEAEIMFLKASGS